MTRSTAATRAARTLALRREFIARYGQESLSVLRYLVTGKGNVDSFSARSLAAWKANFTRGTYSDFVSVNARGTVTRDSLNLSRMR